jgi:hypothetical protein
MDRGEQTGRLRLDHLGPTDLTPLYGNKRVVGHILGLEGRNLEASSFQYPAKGCRGDGFAHITAGPQKHDGFGHFVYFPQKWINSDIFCFGQIL